MDIQNRVVIVTGASAGIGRATAIALAEAGAHVVISARRKDRLESLRAQMMTLPVQMLVVAGDVRDEAFCKQLVSKTIERFGRVDILINNAGIGHWSEIAEIPMKHLHQLTEVNIYAPIYLIQAVLPHMETADSGLIVNISSIVWTRPLQKAGVYSASKVALAFISRALRMELRGKDIQVMNVYPGRTVSEFQEKRLGDEGVKGRVNEVSAETVAARIIQAIDKGQEEVYINLFDWIFTHANRLFPRLTDFLFARFLNR